MELAHTQMFQTCLNIMSRGKYMDTLSFNLFEHMCYEKTLYVCVRHYCEVQLLCDVLELYFYL